MKRLSVTSLCNWFPSRNGLFSEYPRQYAKLLDFRKNPHFWIGNVYCPYDKTSLKAVEGASATTSETPPAGKEWIDPVTKMTFVWVPGGCFQMGCGPWSGICNPAEIPVHEVCVKGFYLGKFEVTQGQWKKVMGGNPSRFVSCGSDCPVEQVSWEDTRLFIMQINNKSPNKFRLPTEAQWEYAARSRGQAEKYAGGSNLNSLGWYDQNGKDRTHPVGGKAPNGLGIHDMSGNVWEWCEDGFVETIYKKHTRSDPVNKSCGCGRVMRGGAGTAGTGAAKPPPGDGASRNTGIMTSGSGWLRFRPGEQKPRTYQRCRVSVHGVEIPRVGLNPYIVSVYRVP